MSTMARSFWRPLKRGDIVDLVAPGFRPAPSVLDRAEDLIRSWGLVPRRPREIFGRDILCSHRDERRAQYLIEALEASDSRAVWCMRGGYGSIRLVPQLLKRKRPRFLQPKLFVGLSDITTLHIYLNQVWSWPTVHGPHLDRLVNEATTKTQIREMKRLAFGELSQIEVSRLKPLNEMAKRDVRIEGSLCGGNLKTLESSIGTQLQPSSRGQLVFFEDIGERGYRIDRMLEHLRQAGYFNQCQAILFGQFTGGQEPDGGTRVTQVLKRFAQAQSVPVFMGVPCGHGKQQKPLPFYTTVKLDCRAATLVIDTGCEA